LTGPGDRELAELAERYFQVTMDAAPFNATVYGVRGWDAEVPDLSEAAEADTDRRLAGLQRRLAVIDPGPPGDHPGGPPDPPDPPGDHPGGPPDPPGPAPGRALVLRRPDRPDDRPGP
jgi:hypothetical protein